MTLLQELEAKKPTHGINAAFHDAIIDEAIALIRAFADKLEGEEMVEKVARAIHVAAFGISYLSEINESDRKYAKAALAVVGEMIL